MLFKTGSNTVHTKAPSKVFFFFLNQNAHCYLRRHQFAKARCLHTASSWWLRSISYGNHLVGCEGEQLTPQIKLVKEAAKMPLALISAKKNSGPLAVRTGVRPVKVQTRNEVLSLCGQSRIIQTVSVLAKIMTPSGGVGRTLASCLLWCRDQQEDNPIKSKPTNNKLHL